MLIFKIIKLKKNINSNIKIYFFDIFLPPTNHFNSKSSFDQKF